MSKIVLVIPALILLIACSTQDKKATEMEDSPDAVWISGEVKYPVGKGQVVLQHYTNNQLETVDTLELKDRKFLVKVTENLPGFYRIDFYGRQIADIVLDDENIHVIADGDRSDGNLVIEGSTEQQHIEEMTRLKQEFNDALQQLNYEYINAYNEGKTERVAQLEDTFQILQKQYNSSVKQAIRDMDASLVALRAVNELDVHQDIEFLDSLAGALAKIYPDLDYVQNFNEQVERLKLTAIGSVAPNIQLPNPEGDTVALTSLRGKYVLIDFWAAWCRPCRQENPNVVQAYHNFKNQNFEILGVSLDRDRKAWVSAIAEDKLVWPQVSDLKYFNSAAARDYQVEAIPYNVLIDPEGKIVAKNLRGKALHDKLSEILGQT